jgi:hypothetical protein
MSGFEVYASQIRTSGKQLKAAAEGVKGANPSGEVDAVATALPGSQSAGAASKLSSTWKSRFQNWHDDADGQGDKVIASADTYDQSDYAADVRLRNAARHLGEPLV